MHTLVKEVVETALACKAETGQDLYHVDTVMGASRYVADALRISRTLPLPARILDLGCGCGQMTYLLKRLGYDVVASDIFTNEELYYLSHYITSYPNNPAQ